MAPECCRAGGAARRVGWAALPGLALLAVPKCPLCLAAYLSVVVGTGAAAPLSRALHPLGVVAAVLAAVLAVVAVAARLRRARGLCAGSRPRQAGGAGRCAPVGRADDRD